LRYFPRKGIALFSQERNCVIFLGKEFDYFPRKGIGLFFPGKEFDYFPRKGI
jgi:hypothetical protein